MENYNVADSLLNCVDKYLAPRRLLKLSSCCDYVRELHWQILLVSKVHVQ